MTSKLNTVGVIGLAAIASFAATPALAAGTTAGTTITNTATVDYQVGGVAQGQQSAANAFTVDRKINLLVEEVGTVTTNVVPGQTNAVTTFQLTNSSNEVLDFALVASQIVGGTAAHGGTDTFNVNNVRIYRDNTATGTIGSWDAGDTLITGYVDELVVDTAIRLFVVADIPAGLVQQCGCRRPACRYRTQRCWRHARRGDHRNRRREHRGQGHRLCRHRRRCRRRCARRFA